MVWDFKTYYNGWFTDITILGNRQMLLWNLHHSVTSVLPWFLFLAEQRSLFTSVLAWQKLPMSSFLSQLWFEGNVAGTPYTVLGSKNHGFSIDFTVASLTGSKSWVPRRAPPSLTLVFRWLRRNAVAPCWMHHVHWTMRLWVKLEVSLQQQNQWFWAINCMKPSMFCPSFGWVICTWDGYEMIETWPSQRGHQPWPSCAVDCPDQLEFPVELQSPHPAKGGWLKGHSIHGSSEGNPFNLPRLWISISLPRRFPMLQQLSIISSAPLKVAQTPQSRL